MLGYLSKIQTKVEVKATLGSLNKRESSPCQYNVENWQEWISLGKNSEELTKVLDMERKVESLEHLMLLSADKNTVNLAILQENI